MIEIRGLNKTYDPNSAGANHVLQDISITLPDTGFVCIVGVSGCGKTSLLNAVGGLDSFDSGTIVTDRVSVSRSGTRRYEQERNGSFSYIFQNYCLLPEHSVAYNVYLGLHSLELSHREKLDRVREALEAVNMARYSRRIAGELSGGQQQRVAIARALARRPRVIFADEPTGNLDEENTVNICTLLRKISRTSLVVMVTHEQNIARFFADRIITLGDGKVLEDSESWVRTDLSASIGSTLYAGDYREQELSSEELRIRVLTEEGCAPAELTIAVLKDKIIVKTNDSRTISSTRMRDIPVLKEGKRPVMKLEAVDRKIESDRSFADMKPDVPLRAGAGLSWSMMFQEARRLLRGREAHRLSVWFFLAVMSVLVLWLVGDYLTVSAVDPKDFVITDSHILELSLERGADLDPELYDNVLTQVRPLLESLRASDVEFTQLPYVSGRATIFLDTIFPQLREVSVSPMGFSYVPVENLAEDMLICGRLPENSQEVVVDRWVLDNILKTDSMLPNVLYEPEQFLGLRLQYQRKNLAPEIVGICDCKEPTIYFSKAAFASLGNIGTEVVTLAEFQSAHPGWYEDTVLSGDECLVLVNNAGDSYSSRVGASFKTKSGVSFTIAEALWAETYALIVVSEEGLDRIMESMTTGGTSLCFYAQDKQALKNLIKDTVSEQFDGLVQYQLRDINGSSWEAYRKASTLRADARLVVTGVVIILSMVMLYLLQRSFVQQRIGMMSVYRLLGLPGRKLAGIFALESFLLSLVSVLPAVALTWLTVWVLNLLTDLNFHMILPWQAGVAVYLAVAGYFLLVSLLPVFRLLRLPPARLAAKYDI